MAYISVTGAGVSESSSFKEELSLVTEQLHAAQLEVYWVPANE